MKSKSKITVNFLLPIIIFVAVCIFDWNYMGAEDFSAVLVWWLVLVLIGLVFQPITLILFNSFHDNGWMFSKTIGIAFSAWLLWYLSGIKLLKFTQLNCYIIIGICFLINVLVFKLYNKHGQNKIDFRKAYSLDKLNSMLNSEVIFFCFFAIWCYIKGYNASAYGTEKFMDYGFLTAILKSDYMPAHDLWFAGEGINYYYVGQYISAWLIRVTGISVGYGYNLMMMTLAALGFSLPYSIGYNLMRFNRRSAEKSEKIILPEDKKGFVCALTGVLSGVGLSLAGNMHFPIYKWIMPKIDRILGREVDDYWFSNPTRYIGYDPDIDDKTIHEYPSYSFVLGDLHAHVINIMFVLTVVALLLAWLYNRKAKMEIAKSEDKPCKLHLAREVFNPHLVMCMFFIGLFNMTNYWDFPIYFVVCGAVILFSNLVTYRYKKEAWILTAAQAIAFIVVMIVVALPFTLSFDSISSAIKFCDTHTSLFQLMVLWGLPTIIVGVFIAVKIKEWREKKTKFLDSLSVTDLFVFILGLCGLGLVLLPEIIYVVDIYGGAYKRANTMFKLVYQAFMLLAISMPYIIVKFLYFARNKLLKKFSIVALILLCSTFCYFFEACEDWFSSYYDTLDASAFLESESPDDKLGIDWINENVSDDAVVLEMCGESYTFFNRISVFTGNSTVLGWQTHEWLWRSSGNMEYPAKVSERHNDVIAIYTSTNVKEVQALIEKYKIDYIYVGEAEMLDGYSSSDDNSGYNYHGSRYTRINTNHAMLKSLGEVIMISEATDSKPYETYIVKVDRNLEIPYETISNSSSLVTEQQPDKIIVKDNEGNRISSTEYSYDELGNLVSETNYDALGTITSYSIYTYDGITPIFGEDFDASGNRVGFWNYVEFDVYGNLSKKHYFDSNDKWVLTDDIVTDVYSNVLNETFSYADGTEKKINYSYSDGLMLAKQVNEDGKTTVYQYKRENGRIVYADISENGELVGQLSYEYNE